MRLFFTNDSIQETVDERLYRLVHITLFVRDQSSITPVQVYVGFIDDSNQTFECVWRNDSPLLSVQYCDPFYGDFGLTSLVLLPRPEVFEEGHYVYPTLTFEWTAEDTEASKALLSSTGMMSEVELPPKTKKRRYHE